MRIGKIVSAPSHIEYVCQISQAGEVAEAPGPADHAFGTLVRIGTAAPPAIVGLIYDTVLLNPDYGTLGPRLSPAPDLAVFSPDYLNEKATLAGIVAVGCWDGKGAPVHGVPPHTAQIDALVESMDDQEVRAFHASGAGSVRLGYAPLLIAQGRPLARHLLLAVIERLATLCPEAGRQLEVLRANVGWRAAVEPLG